MPYLKLDENLVERHARDERYAHTFWSFPKDHPIRLHDGPGIIVVANPKRRRAYVLAARTQTVHKAAEGLIGRLRHYIRDLNGEAHHKPYTDPSRPAPRATSLDLPHDLAWDWDKDRPESFVWLLADPFPTHYKRHFSTPAEYKNEVSRRKRDVVSVLEHQGWKLYNPNMRRGLSLPGARMAYLDQRAAFEAERTEYNHNHLRWVDMLANGGPGLDSSVDPNDLDIQRAYARHQAMMGQPLPKPGDSIPGHRSSDRYTFKLEQGQLTINCPPDCLRHVEWSTTDP